MTERKPRRPYTQDQKKVAVLLMTILCLIAAVIVGVFASIGVPADRLEKIAIVLAFSLHIYGVLRNGVLGIEAMTVVFWAALAVVAVYGLA
jgi:hypothetical protein